MNLLTNIYAVNQREKVAGQVLPGLRADKLALWNYMKTAASKDSQGTAVGLARLFLKHAVERLQTGEMVKVAESRQALTTTAASIGSAYAVDLTIAKLAHDQEITRDEAKKLAALNAESVFFEIGRLFKSSEEACTHVYQKDCSNCTCPHGAKNKNCDICCKSKTASLLEQLRTDKTKEAGILGSVGQLGRAIGTSFGGMRGAAQAARAFGDPIGQSLKAVGQAGSSAFRQAGGLSAAKRLAPVGIAAGGAYALGRSRHPQQQQAAPPMM
jgi:hypothetical protein